MILNKAYVKDNINLYVVVSALNEQETLQKVIDDLAPLTKHIVIVSDGSTDKTAEIAVSNGCILIEHPKNMGQGAAIRTGILYAMENNADLIATFDADGQHDAGDLHNMVIAILEKKKEAILGSRFLGSAPGIPLKRIVLLKAGIFFTFLFSGVFLTDVHNGLRLFTRDAAAKLDLSADDMTHASVITDSIIRQKMLFLEFPVTIRYTPYSKMKGQKLMDIIKTGIYLIGVKTRKKIKVYLQGRKKK